VKVKVSPTFLDVGTTPLEIAPLATNVPVGVTDGVKVFVGDGPMVAVKVGVGGVPVTVFGGVGVIVFVGPKFELFKMMGKWGLNASCSIIWAEEPTIGTRTIPMTSKHTRMINNTLAVSIKNETRPARIFFIYINISLLNPIHAC
jgi:hypothetical protein